MLNINNNGLLGILTLLKEVFPKKELYLVGGTTRDIILDIIPKDYDLVTDIPIEELLSLFSNNNIRVNISGQNFKVLKIYIESHFKKEERFIAIEKKTQVFDIANFRKDSKESDGRRPSFVYDGTIEDDAFRRDFTLNSLYLNPFTYEIKDPTNKGLEDLENNILRFVGEPKERILEDYLRVFRFFRFLTKGFKPDNYSFNVILNLFELALEKTNKTRIQQELEKIQKDLRNFNLERDSKLILKDLCEIAKI